MIKKKYTTKLSTIADVIQGQSPESNFYSECDGVPFLQGNRTFGNLFPFFDTYTHKVTKMAAKGDVLMSVRAPVGALNYAPCDLCIGRGLASIRAKDGNNQFVYYALKYNVNNLIKQGSATTFDSVNKDIINDFELIIPENKIERNIIAKVLSDLDAKIELNNRINRELEAMAKTLYDYWFVQFDFPNEQGKPYKSSGGKMVYNAELKRKIPEGWEVKKLVQIEPNIITGKTPSTTILENFGGNIPFITIDDIRGQLFILSAERTLSKRGADSQPTKYLKKGDICVSCIGTIGVIGIVNQISQSNQQINTVSINNSYNRYFLLNALKNYFDFNVAAKKGAVLSNMNKAEFSDIPILDSVSSIKEKFNKLVEPIYNKVEINLKQNQQLTELRDWLLPMLMNGQVTVKEAEERLSMAAEPSVEYKKEEKYDSRKI